MKTLHAFLLTLFFVAPAFGQFKTTERATATRYGVVKPDNVTITIANGVITAVGGGGGVSMPQLVALLQAATNHINAKSGFLTVTNPSVGNGAIQFSVIREASGLTLHIDGVGELGSVAASNAVFIGYITGKFIGTNDGVFLANDTTLLNGARLVNHFGFKIMDSDGQLYTTTGSAIGSLLQTSDGKRYWPDGTHKLADAVGGMYNILGYQWLQADGSVIFTNVANSFTGDGSGLVNVPVTVSTGSFGTAWVTNMVTPTNTFSGTVADFGKSSWWGVLAADLTFTGVANLTAGAENGVIITLGAGGVDRAVAVPATWGVTPGATVSGQTLYVTNGTKSAFLVDCIPGWSTNITQRVISK